MAKVQSKAAPKKATAKKEVAPIEVATEEQSRELTFGEVLIGTEFTQDPVDSIHIVKMLAADMANHVVTASNPESVELSPLKSDLLRSAIAQLSAAQMACVKVMTFQH